MTTAELPISSFSAALLLAELYQYEGRLDEAIRLLESLGAVSGQAILALSLAELYAACARWDDVIRVSEEFTRNVDDPTAQLLTLRGIALGEKGLNEAALTSLREALRSKSRNPLLLRTARYARGEAYERAGKKGMARRDFEKVYVGGPVVHRHREARDRLRPWGQGG